MPSTFYGKVRFISAADPSIDDIFQDDDMRSKEILDRIFEEEATPAKRVPGLSGVPGVASRAAIELDSCRSWIESDPNFDSGEASLERVAQLIQKVSDVADAAQPKNFKRTTATSLISQAITESLGLDKPRTFDAAVQTLRFFACRLQMVIDGHLGLDDIISLRDMCLKISKNTSPYAQKMVKKGY